MWFNDVFLNSLFERAGLNSPLWLTKKQTAICCQYMIAETIVVEEQYGQYRHTNYTYNWNEREVFLSYSKKNGCGTITFYPNGSEKRQIFNDYCAERRKKALDDVNRRVKQAERFVNGETPLRTKYTPGEYINRLRKSKRHTAEDFHRYVCAYHNSGSEDKAQIEIKLFELYHEFRALKKCIEITEAAII